MLLLPVFGVAAAIGSDESTTERPRVADVLGEGGPTLLTPDEALRADAEMLAKAEGISSAEAIGQLEFQVETTAWLNELDERNALGDGFAGSRVSLEDRELIVYFKGKAPIADAALDRGSVRVVDGQRFSMADLEKVHQYLADAAHGLGFEQASASVDIETQRFTLEVGGLDTGRASMSSAEVEDAVRSALSTRNSIELASDDIAVIVRNEAFLETSHSYGGADVADDGNRECTSAFAVEDSSTGVDGVLTAAHCEGINQIADYGNGNLYSAPFMREYYNSQGDFEFHTTTHWEFPIFYTTDTSARVVGSRIANNAISEDTWVCRYGRRTGQSCGWTDSISAMMSDWWAGCSCTRTVTDGVRVRENTVADIGGDSGGPWFLWTGALGVHWGHNDSTGSQFFSKIQNAEDRLNVDVLLCVPSC